MTSLADIRSTFLGYFARHGHEVIASSPLVPRNDPTLMFANSGMVQFKNVFTGLETLPYRRAATAQKCVRAGGKHNDLDNVGYTARHHTFFEMLGNFSFGDYFKDEAIAFAWRLLTQDYGIPADRLTVTVYHTDDEAAAIWRRAAGLPEERIIRIATSDNFWMMGPTGPCGPCTEIFYDHGPTVWGGPPGSPEADGDRFVEIWNLVFMQFEAHEDGSRTALPRPSIDTGMGLERIGALLQGKRDNYDTDVMRALIEASAHATSSDPDGRGRVHHRVIADHLRASAFLVADGVLPSNEGRGYVLRRIMRRAMRHAAMLGARDPVMHRLVPTLLREMGQAYPELARGEALIADTLRREETRFRETLERGLRLLDDELARLPEGAALPGEAAFRLYATYGFPFDLTQDALREKGRGVDAAGFERAMAQERARARASWAGSGEAKDAAVWFDLAERFGATEFLGYDTERAEAQVLALVRDGRLTERLAPGETAWLVTNQTPFYAESGGQAADRGTVRKVGAHDTSGLVADTQKFAEGRLVAHRVTLERGALAVGEPVALEVDHRRRSAIRAAHSATHLLNEALRRHLGEHVAQRGSLNEENRIRFDFAHGKALAPEELAAVEAEVNAHIRQNAPVVTRLMAPEDARRLGAQALFGEKYGEEVRVVAMGAAPGSGKGADGDTYSVELCGGTHVARTGEIGAFVTLADSASSAGVRRIEALTGQAALDHLRAQGQRLAEIAQTLRVPLPEVVDRVRALADERRRLENELAQLRRNLALGGGAAPAAPARQVAGVSFRAQVLSGVTGRDLPALIDGMKAELGTGAVLLIAEEGGKTAVAAGVTTDLASRLSAVDILRAAVAELGGRGGGGRPDLAQGGAASAQNADAAIRAAEAVIEGASA
jgi:alanyl-tRNA synthetase